MVKVAWSSALHPRGSHVRPEDQLTEQSVETFIRSIADEGRRQDCLALRDVMEVTGCEPRLWGRASSGPAAITTAT